MLPISPRRTAFRARRAWTGWIAALCLLLATQLALAGPAPAPGALAARDPPAPPALTHPAPSSDRPLPVTRGTPRAAAV